MSSVKEAAIRLIQSLPEDCTLEDVQYHLYVREKVERGIQAIDEGKVLSQEEVDRRMEEWLESFGQKQRSKTSTRSRPSSRATRKTTPRK
jgi:hypothetical protein